MNDNDASWVGINVLKSRGLESCSSSAWAFDGPDCFVYSWSVLFAFCRLFVLRFSGGTLYHLFN